MNTALWSNIFSKVKSRQNIPNGDLLKLCPLFSSLNFKELKMISSLIYERNYQKDEFLFEKGQPGTAVFIVKSGLIKVTTPAVKKDEVELAIIEEKGFLGELALLDDTARPASAKAVEKTTVLAFYREDLGRLMETYPLIASKIMRELALVIGQRLRQLNEQLIRVEETREKK